jgi:hypothetical protein
VRLVRADPTRVQREMTSNALNSDHPSTLSTQMLQRLGLYSMFRTIRSRHCAAPRGLEAQGERYRLFALAELSYYHAERSGDRSYYLAAAVYAYALLFPSFPAKGGSIRAIRGCGSPATCTTAASLWRSATGERGQLSSEPRTWRCRSERSTSRPATKRPPGEATG